MTLGLVIKLQAGDALQMLVVGCEECIDGPVGVEKIGHYGRARGREPSSRAW